MLFCIKNLEYNIYKMTKWLFTYIMNVNDDILKTSMNKWKTHNIKLILKGVLSFITSHCGSLIEPLVPSSMKIDLSHIGHVMR